jgi:uncharacterized protein
VAELEQLAELAQLEQLEKLGQLAEYLTTEAAIMRRDDAYRLELLVLQPTPFCNLDCDYCYLAERSSTARMSPPVLRRTIEQVLASGFVHDGFTVVWHAGEPLVVPIEYYEQALEIIRQLTARAGVHVDHAIQTNATLVTPAWCEFLQRHDVRVGVSVDGPAFLHDAHRKTRSGKGTHERVMRGIRCLQEHGVDFHVISVLTMDALAYPDELFDFYVTNGIRRVGFNIEEIEGLNKSSTLSPFEASRKFRAFMTRFLERVSARGTPLEVREFEGFEQLITERAEYLRQNQENTPLRIISVDWAGNFSTFSPELLGVRNDIYGTFYLGNVIQDDLATVTTTRKFLRMVEDVEAGIAACERTCDYFGLCGGGSPSNKFFETGSFRGTETLHCRLSKKVMADLLVERFEQSLGLVAQS